MAEQEPDPLTQIEGLGDVEKWAILWGYVGEAANRPAPEGEGGDGEAGGGEEEAPPKVQRLYLDLTKEHWLEINVDAIYHRQDLETARGSLIWVPWDTWITRVEMARAGNFNAAAGFLAGGFWPQAGWPGDDEHGGPPKTSIPTRCC